MLKWLIVLVLDQANLEIVYATLGKARPLQVEDNNELGIRLCSLQCFKVISNSFLALFKQLSVAILDDFPQNSRSIGIASV